MDDTAETDQALEARRQLREELEPHIDILHATRGEPPFTLGELIVCAIISHDKKYATAEDIAKWIMKACAFYAHQAIDKYMTTLVEHEQDRYEDGFMSEVSFPISGFWDAMKEYDLPIEVLEADSSTDPNDSGNAIPKVRLPRRIERSRRSKLQRYSKTPWYTIDAGPARVYLRRWLCQRQGRFRFFALAPELRNRIYTMLLVYDDKAHLATQGRLVLPGPLSRDRHSLAKLERSQHLPLRREYTTRTLALLGSCRQARREGSSIFYSLNTFYYQGFNALGGSLLKSSGVNLDMLRRLSLSAEFLPETARYRKSEACLVSKVRANIAGVRLFGQLQLDELVLFQASCPVYAGCEPQDHYLELLDATQADDEVDTLITQCLDAMVSAARGAKHVKVHPYGGCNALERYILAHLKEVASVKMLCCSFPKHRDEDMLYL